MWQSLWSPTLLKLALPRKGLWSTWLWEFANKAPHCTLHVSHKSHLPHVPYVSCRHLDVRIQAYWYSALLICKAHGAFTKFNYLPRHNFMGQSKIKCLNLKFPVTITRASRFSSFFFFSLSPCFENPFWKQNISKTSNNITNNS